MNHEIITVEKLVEYLKVRYNVEVVGRGSSRVIKFNSGKEGSVLISRRTNPRGGNTQASGVSDYQIFINPNHPDNAYSRVYIIDEKKFNEQLSAPQPGGPVTLNSSGHITINYPHAGAPEKNRDFWERIRGRFDENNDDGIVYYNEIRNFDYISEAGERATPEGLENIYSEILSVHSNVIIEGVAGSGKSHILRELRASGAYGDNGSRLEVVVFHPSTSYEEFVTGIRPNFVKSDEASDFITHEGVFVQMCNRAANDPDNQYLLFIDEINRANTSRVFGDLMLVLEKTKRLNFEEISGEGRSGALFEAAVQEIPGDYVRLQTSVIKDNKEYNKLSVPSNLYVLGTMNTTDRSVGTIDLALRRRFHWVTRHPYAFEELKVAIENAGEVYPEETAGWFDSANKILLDKVGPDARLGHAYFFGKDGDEEAIAEALLNQLKEVAFTFNISQAVLDEIGPIIGKKVLFMGSGLGARPDIVAVSGEGNNRV